MLLPQCCVYTEGAVAAVLNCCGSAVICRICTYLDLRQRCVEWSVVTVCSLLVCHSIKDQMRSFFGHALL